MLLLDDFKISFTIRANRYIWTDTLLMWKSYVFIKKYGSWVESEVAFFSLFFTVACFLFVALEGSIF